MTEQGAFPEQVLLRAQEGAALLAPLMTAAGFQPPAVELVRGSGGPAAVATWRRGDGLAVEAHVRGSLGIVRYGWGEAAMTHQYYLRARSRRCEYPRFSNSLAMSRSTGPAVSSLSGPSFDRVSDNLHW